MIHFKQKTRCLRSRTGQLRAGRKPRDQSRAQNWWLENLIGSRSRVQSLRLHHSEADCGACYLTSPTHQYVCAGFVIATWFAVLGWHVPVEIYYTHPVEAEEGCLSRRNVFTWSKELSWLHTRHSVYYSSSLYLWMTFLDRQSLFALAHSSLSGWRRARVCSPCGEWSKSAFGRMG